LQTAAEVSPTESLKQHVRFDLNDDEHIQKPLTPSPSTRPRSPPPPPPSSPHLQRPAVKRFPVIPPAPATFLHHQNHKIDLPIRVYCKMLTVDQLRQNAALPPVNLVNLGKSSGGGRRRDGIGLLQRDAEAAGAGGRDGQEENKILLWGRRRARI
jgi:hypothetical protein